MVIHRKVAKALRINERALTQEPIANLLGVRREGVVARSIALRADKVIE
jgi:predicted transcriptional regulator